METKHLDPNLVNESVSSGGHRDAAEQLHEQLYALYRLLGIEWPELLNDIDLLTHYIAANASADIPDLMSSDFSRGYLIGRVVSLMEADIELSNQEELENEEN